MTKCLEVWGLNILSLINDLTWFENEELKFCLPYILFSLILFHHRRKNTRVSTVKDDKTTTFRPWNRCSSKLSCLIYYFVSPSKWCVLPYSTALKKNAIQKQHLFPCLKKFWQIKADNYHSVSSGWTCFAWYVWDYSWIHDHRTVMIEALSLIQQKLSHCYWCRAGYLCCGHERCQRIVLA